ncbi:phage tail tape measure protein [Bartonella krasnovii]|uniref:phage tail tape measure protein n=1 Tax=Bartonella krasnovii TaxID=2267275 RepID=UPI001F4C56E5|nr:phage tail tape measure protein [Bartonella krasnovii]UNF36491.1 phage tail tape measure protein [Bartonella krasnovii]UNF39067.1 phage tail tape measure protein [Bartonella krasnovii]UNF44659.1 phage tail tape measure protein [Bartonella krasnovii]UNF50607.1 phage tail tape measure protein [Bartonella krasnovii]
MDVSLVVRFVNHLQEGIASAKRDLKAFSLDIAHFQNQTRKHFKGWFDPEHLKQVTANAESAYIHARGRMVGAVAQTATLIAPLYKAMQFDQSMKGLEKVLDAPLDRLKELRRFALETSTKIPLAAREVLELMTSASQAGIGEQDLEAFSIYAAKAAVAFDMSGDQIGERFAKLRNVFKLNQAGIEDLGDAINHLSNHMAAKASEVSDFTNRATGAATMFKLTARETAAFGTAMISAGIVPESAARGFNSISARIQAGGKHIEDAFTNIGLSRQKFMEDLEKDATGTLVRFFDVLGKSEQGMRSLIAIAGRDFTGDFAKLVGNPELLGQALDYVKDPKVFKGSVEQEADKQATGAMRQFELLQNRIVALGVTIGEVLLPHVNSLMETVGGFLNVLMAWANEHPVLTGVIIKTIAALMAFNIALRVVRFTMAGTRLGVLQLIASFIKMRAVSGALKASWRGLLTSGRSLGLLTAGFGARFLRLLRPMTLLMGALRGIAVSGAAFASSFGWVGTVIEVVGASLSSVVGGLFTPVGAVIAAVVAVILAAGFALWKYWDRFSSFIKGFARGITRAFGQAFEAVMRFFGADTSTITHWKNIIASAFDFSQNWQKFKQGLSFVAQSFEDLWEGIKQSLSNFWEWLKRFFSQEKLTDSAKASMEQAGEDLASWIVNGFMGTISQLTDFCKSLPHRIKGWIGSIDVRDYLPSFLGGKTPQPLVQFAGAGRANAPFTEAKDKERVPITHNQNVTVHVNGARDPMATGYAVRHALQRAGANALHGGTE